MNTPLRQSGIAAVEFALLLALLLVPLTFVTVEAGRAFYQYNTLVKASRAAAREYTVAGRVGTLGSREALATCLAVYGKIPCAGGDTPLLPALSPSLVAITTADATLPGGGLPYTYGCVAIGSVTNTSSRFKFQLLIPWLLPEDVITFAPIRTCMRQVP